MTDEQKQMVGQIFGQLLKTEVSSNPESVITAYIDSISDTENEDFLNSVKRCILAWNDFAVHSGENGLIRAFATVMRSGTVDPIIFQSMTNTIGPRRTVALDLWLSLKGRDIEIEREVISDNISDNKVTFGDGRYTANVASESFRYGVSSASGSLGGMLGLWSMVGNADVFFEDLDSGGMQATFSTLAKTAEISDIALSASSIYGELKLARNGFAEGGYKTAIKYAGRLGIPLAIASGICESVAGFRANDAQRVSEAIGGTAGGILGGLMSGAATGAGYGLLLGSPSGAGAIVTVTVGSFIGALAGALGGAEFVDTYFRGSIEWLMNESHSLDNVEANYVASASFLSALPMETRYLSSLNNTAGNLLNEIILTGSGIVQNFENYKMNTLQHEHIYIALLYHRHFLRKIAELSEIEPVDRLSELMGGKAKSSLPT